MVPLHESCFRRTPALGPRARLYRENDLTLAIDQVMASGARSRSSIGNPVSLCVTHDIT